MKSRWLWKVTTRRPLKVGSYATARGGQEAAGQINGHASIPGSRATWCSRRSQASTCLCAGALQSCKCKGGCTHSNQATVQCHTKHACSEPSTQLVEARGTRAVPAWQSDKGRQQLAKLAV